MLAYNLFTPQIAAYSIALRARITSYHLDKDGETNRDVLVSLVLV